MLKAEWGKAPRLSTPGKFAGMALNERKTLISPKGCHI